MPDVCPNLPDELDRLDETIAGVLLSVGRSSPPALTSLMFVGDGHA